MEVCKLSSCTAYKGGVKMDRKEAILRIKDHMEHHGIGKYPHLKLKEAFDMSIAALDAPNEPLTLDELRQMDGEPVWVEDKKTWALLQVWDDDNIDAVFPMPRGCFHAESVVGKKIYRRPPEGGEET